MRLSETRSDKSVSTNALIDTGSNLTIVSPEWCERINAKIGPWEGPQLWMANATTASVNGVAEIEVSNSRGKAAGTALVMLMNGYDLLLGNNFLRQFGTLRIEYTTDGHQITLGEELPAGDVEEETKPIPLRVAKGRRIPRNSIARVRSRDVGERRGAGNRIRLAIDTIERSIRQETPHCCSFFIAWSEAYSGVCRQFHGS